MFGVKHPKLTTKLLHRREADVALGISQVTFWRKWNAVFTDPRSKVDRKPSIERKVYEDELATAVAAGGNTRGMAAVLAFRALMGRADL
ncbi:MAG TPA: hypothetical protein VG122_22135 [Gemmata sp.]|jgi:hypothetical protein|nr:hypothetical protein [Gemmata sp.]